MLNPVKWYWNTATLPLKIVIAVALIIVIALIGRAVIGWFAPTVRYDHATVDRINNRNAADAKAEIKQTVQENLDVIKTVDGRTELVNLSVEERDKEIEKVVAAASVKTEAAKQIKGDVTGPELECILLPEKCQ